MSHLQDRSAYADPKVASVVPWIQVLQSHETREEALIVLSKNREFRKDFAPLLWNSFGTISTLLLEIITVYRLLSSPNLTERASNRVSNALALFQCVTSAPDTRMQFLKEKLPYYLYPFLSTKNKEKAHEYLRLTSLGVIGALVKSGDPEVISFLIETQIFPCCLNSMELGSELSKTMTEKVAEKPSPRLLKHIVRCCRWLSDNPRLTKKPWDTFKNCSTESQLDSNLECWFKNHTNASLARHCNFVVCDDGGTRE